MPTLAASSHAESRVLTNRPMTEVQSAQRSIQGRVHTRFRPQAAGCDRDRAATRRRRAHDAREGRLHFSACPKYAGLVCLTGAVTTQAPSSPEQTLKPRAPPCVPLV
jgi:hypothetical protein